MNNLLGITAYPLPFNQLARQESKINVGTQKINLVVWMAQCALLSRLGTSGVW